MERIDTFEWHDCKQIRDTIHTHTARRILNLLSSSQIWRQKRFSDCLHARDRVDRAEMFQFIEKHRSRLPIIIGKSLVRDSEQSRLLRLTGEA